MDLENSSAIIDLSNEHGVNVKIFRRMALVHRALLYIRLLLLSPIAGAMSCYLVSVSWSLTKLFFSKQMNLSDPAELRLVLVLPAFLWFSIFNISLDALLHMWASARLLLTRELPEEYPTHTIGLAWIWLLVSTTFLLHDTLVVFLLFDYISVLTKIVSCVVALHFVSFVSVLAYIIQIYAYLRVYQQE